MVVRRPLLLGLLALTAAGVTACSDSGTGPETGPDPDPDPDPVGDTADVNGYVAGLGTWEEFSPPAATADTASGPDAVVEETVEEPDVNGVLQQVIYQCTETPYSLTDTPREIVMYEPNASIMWVGNLIQGKSYANGQGSFQELSIRQRDTLRLSIDLLTGDNFAEVGNPSLTTVQSAIGQLIQQATDAGHRSGSSIDYEEAVTYSVEQAALKLGISGHYMGGKAKADLSASRSANERTMVAHFVQKMFTIAIELPQSPEDMFSDDLTQALWDQQVAAGNVGPNNLPVYIAQITYGRTLTYSLTSTHSESRMRAAISASYNGVAGGVSGYSEAELRETLGQQNIKVTAIGGEGQNVLDLISSGDLKAYFTTDAPLTSAKPISYQLNFLGDNSIAKVAETTDYSLRTCEPRAAAGGRFEFLELQEAGAPVPVPYSVLKGDLNGDGRGDLVWSHRSAGSNVMAVGFGQADGRFDIRGAVTHPDAPIEGWSSATAVLVGDVDGDGMDDLVFNRPANVARNAIYVSFSQGDGTFEHAPRMEHSASDWVGDWKPFVGDVDGDGDADLIWNRLSTASSNNLTFISLSNGDGTFTHGARMDRVATGWEKYAARVGDVDGDGKDDLFWNTTIGLNRTYTGRSNGDGTLAFLAASDAPNSGWDPYSRFEGDFNRDGRLDQMWIDLHVTRDPTPIHRSLGRLDGRWDFVSGQVWPRPDGAGELDAYVGDFNGDGGDDVLFNELGAGVNHVWVGLSNVDAHFDFTPLDQEHGATVRNEDWTSFDAGVLVLDVDGDGRDDIVWNERSATTRIYVGRAKAKSEG